MNNLSERVEQLSPLKRAMLALDKMQAKLDKLEQAKNEPIAIVGMGCRFPGEANSPETFWQLLQSGKHITGELPKQRWDIDSYYDPDPGKPGKIYTRYGSFLSQVDKFDADFFGISPREAISMDPQQRLLLEVSWEALENGGQVPERLKNTQTGVFVGIMYSDYNHRVIGTGNPENIDLYTSSGVGFSFLAGRLSYLLGLHGPSVVMDTACSSSLVSIHLACQSLRLGECKVALAGGVNLILSPEVSVALSRLRALAPDGRCKTFDAAANGYTRGEGCGMIVLKRLSDAIANNDNILAVIRGSAVNHDGASSGLTVPNGLAQQTLMRQALENAQVQPQQVGYIEAHGTGTSLGDPIEVRALEAVYGQNRDTTNPLLIGSVKTNIGHLESAAGIAGLIKVILALQHQEIPAHLHLQSLNPHISLLDNRIQIPVEHTPWNNVNGKRIAGVSSFGLSGTNAHIILEEAPVETIQSVPDSASAFVLPLSAKTPTALQELVQNYKGCLETVSSTFSLQDICYNASVRRSHHNYRLAFVGDSQQAIQNKLDAYLQSQTNDTSKELNESPRIAFIFTPLQTTQQETNWWTNWQQLLHQPTFQETLEQCNQLFEKYAGWSLLEQLKQKSRLTQSEVSQPIIVALQISLATLWRSWGIQPSAIAGYGLSEIAAAYIAGVLNLDTAMQLLFYQLDAKVNKTSFTPVDVTQPASIPIYSHIAGKLVDGQAVDITKWGDSTSSSTNAGMVNYLMMNGYNTFIEINPLAILSKEIVQISRQQKLQAIHLPSVETPNIYFQLLDSLGQLYTLGCSINWENFYTHISPYVSLPYYPWQRETYWLDFSETKSQASKKVTTQNNYTSANHPLLGYRLEELAHLPGQYIWQTEIDTNSLPYLNDHKVQGRVVLPGAAYVEMALFAAKDAFGEGNYSLENLSFQKALFLPKNEPQRVQVLLCVNEVPNQFDCKIFSRRTNVSTTVSWTLHATATIYLEPEESNLVMLKQVDIKSIQNRCQENLPAADHYQTMSSYGLDYGSSFQGVRQIWRQTGEVLAQIQLPEPLLKVSNPYQIHPVLLDSAFQTFGATQNDQDEDATYLPVGLKSIKVFGSLNQKLWSHLLLHPQAIPNSGTLEGDIFLLNEDGQVVVEVQGFRGQRLESKMLPVSQLDVNNWLYKIEWEPQQIDQSAISQISQQQGHWLIFVDNYEFGQTLGSLLTTQGDTYTLVFNNQTDVTPTSEVVQINPLDPSAFHQLLHQYVQEGQTPCKGVIYAWGSQTSSNLPIDSELLSCSFLHLTQALVKTGVTNLPRLCLVTQGCQVVETSDNDISILQSTLWGLGKVIIQEHPELCCTLIDLGLNNIEQLPALVQELKFNNTENQIAWRQQKRYVARLVDYQLEEKLNRDSSSIFKPDCSYLITGGMGGLGLTIAMLMVEKGARHLALMGRSTPSETAQVAIAGMEKAGANVKIVQADVGVSSQVAEAIKNIEQTMPPLKGIVHSAAVLDDGILLQLNQDRFHKVMTPKIQGAWNLHTQTLGLSLDWFVLFSSAASLIGSPGQGNYSAANAFLDTLANYRKSKGLTALSINWGAWSEVGLAAKQSQNERFANTGFGTISPSQGLEIFAKLIEQSTGQVGVLPADWETLRRSSPALAKLPLLSNLISESQATSNEQTSINYLTAKRSELIAIEVSKRQELLKTWLREYVAQALRLPVEKLDTQKSLNYVGLDSLIAVELKNWIESEIGVVVAMANLLEGPSLDELATQILVKFNAALIEDAISNQPLQESNTQDWEDGEI